MGLHRQLLLVCVVVLLLPWAGCQYIGEMENTLQEGHLRALSATAEAVSTRLSHDQHIVSRFRGLYVPDDKPIFYAHFSARDFLLDGYLDTQDEGNTLSASLSHEDSPFTADVLGIANYTHLIIYANVSDPSSNYYEPGMALHLTDYLEIRLGMEEGEKIFRVYTEAPGEVFVRDERGRIVDLLRAYWSVDSTNAYQLEVQIPLSLKPRSIRLTLYDGSFLPALIFPLHGAGKLIKPDRVLNEALEAFNDGDKKFWLVNNQGWIIASANSRKIEPYDNVFERKEIVENIYRLISSKNSYAKLSNPDTLGKIEFASFEPSINTNQWFKSGKQRIARVRTPIMDRDDQTVLGYVVVQQSTDLFIDLINSAFTRHIFYSFVVSLSVILCLLLYASWISWRVRKLSYAAESAVDESGRINRTFTHSNAGDEIGDLSRSYKRLLGRLEQYTSYLESLASKLSHELRTPIAIVKSSLDNLDHYSLDHDARVYITRAREGIDRLSSILNAMSSASRIEESIRSAESEKLNLAELLTQLVKAYQDIYVTHSIVVIVEESARGATINAVPEMLVQMFDKLIDNATDFGAKDKVIELTLTCDGQKLVFRIKNYGPLLIEDELPQLFDSLYSRRVSTGESHSHLGLGLYIVRLIADFHQANIRAYNEHSEKVVFEIVFTLSELNA